MNGVIKRIRFEYLDDLTIDCYEADPGVNAIFRACLMQHVQPHMLAARLGRLSEETATLNLAKAYSQGVISGSPTPGFDAFSHEQWREWLIEHPHEFTSIREALEPRQEVTLHG